jgi:hypothetical protein
VHDQSPGDAASVQRADRDLDPQQLGRRQDPGHRRKSWWRRRLQAPTPASSRYPTRRSSRCPRPGGTRGAPS